MNEQHEMLEIEKAALAHWRAATAARHGAAAVNDLTNYPGDPDFDESDRRLITRAYWRLSMAARRGPIDEREGAYFEIYGLGDSWDLPRIAFLARKAFAGAPFPVDVSPYRWR